MTIRHLAFVGYSGSGKTTLIVSLLPRLKQAGYRVGVLKHDGHDFEMDRPGTDTFQFGQAGADSVMIASARKMNVTERFANPPALPELLHRLELSSPPPDLILIEGFKHEPTPKILVARTPESLSLLDQLSGVLAIVTPLSPKAATDLPLLHPDDTEAVLAFIAEWLQRSENPVEN